MAMLEAMAAGIPAFGNRHSTSLAEHSVSGFLSDDPLELREFALQLLGDRDLAMRMGREGQRTVRERFSPERFRAGLLHAISIARQKGRRRQMVKASSPL
jgi:glycosyltransferase involved in cell wall biosynthesis